LASRPCARAPLALRIAAANLAARLGRSLTGCAAELADDGRLAKLSVTGDRQAAVRTAFDHSYDALEPDAARLFALRVRAVLKTPSRAVEPDHGLRQPNFS
jgi:hypothetical protein